MVRYLPSVGMEVHAELKTRSKMFCRCPVAFGGEPNTRVCPVCLGLPGALPVPNRAAVEMVVRTALALNCQIAYDSVFHRKNYFYPDLPKGYQVSQYGETNPIGYQGWLGIPVKGGGTKRIAIRRVHLEEDTGKLMHLPSGGSGVDFNRAGVPLMEIVTEFPPDIESADEARDYLVQLRSILVWLGVCDGKMEEGSLRCEPNISIRPEGSDRHGVKTELKNLNSFRAVHQGVLFEVARQSAVLDRGERVVQETRGWNESTQTSFVMRTKESEQDYRYFACPDLAPMHFEKDWVERQRSELPELPLAMQERFQRQFGLNAEHSGLLVSDRDWAEFFEESVRLGGDAQVVCNWMNADFAKLLNESGQRARRDAQEDDSTASLVTPAHLADISRLILNGTVNSKVAKQLLGEAFATGAMPSRLVEQRGLTQVSDASLIQDAVARVIEDNPGPVDQFRSGKEGVIGFLVGKVMRETEGRANPSLVQEEMRRQLEK